MFDRHRDDGSVGYLVITEEITEPATHEFAAASIAGRAVAKKQIPNN